MDHYEVLGVERDADETAIKRAWARMVRQHPPDQDPEGNRRLNEAKAILLDPRARADFDAQSQYGDAIDRLFEEGFEARNEEDWPRAIRVFKEILALHPSSLDARNMLGICLCGEGRFADSAIQYQRLLKEAPDSALYMANVAVTYESWGDSLEEDPEGQKLYYSDAERWVKQAILLEPFNSAHHRQLARLYRAQGRMAEAEAALEAAIGADGKTDIDDIDTMMDLAWLMLFQNQPEKLGKVADRILAVLPNELEAREYATHLFLRNAAQLAEDNYLEPAFYFIRAARRISPNLGEHEPWAMRVENGAQARKEAQEMMEDGSIRPREFVLLVGALVDQRTGAEVEEDVFRRLGANVGTYTREENAKAAQAIRFRYPSVALIVGDLLADAKQMGIPAAVLREQSKGSGCAVIPMALSGMLLLILGGILLGNGATLGIPLLIWGAMQTLGKLISR
ncbi:tetratricopeptide repeat protein [bacterium]|nr:MAG: tetratricopeptide repeat protein [bacterium]